MDPSYDTSSVPNFFGLPRKPKETGTMVSRGTAESLSGSGLGTTTIRLREVREYVTENFQNRECNTYIQMSGKKYTCQCGRDKAWHRDRNIDVNAEATKKIWTSEAHTKLIDATSYGTICFEGFGPGASENVPYIRVDRRLDDDHLEKCWTLLNKLRKMPTPKLIISVTGGAKYFSMTSHLKGKFKRGLMKAATTTKAWILTGGTATGVMKFVGEAVRDHNLTSGQKIVALGIVPWGTVENKEKLTHSLFPAKYRIEDLKRDDVYGVAPLDNNHTHFLLVDDGTERKFGIEIPFRTAFENYISKRLKMTDTDNLAQEKHVPAVILVLEGGENSIRTALEGLQKGTPVVVVKGSGRAADLIAEGYRRTRSKEGGNLGETTLFLDNFHEHFLKEAKSLFPLENEEQVKQKTEECLKNLKDLLTYRHLVTVFTLDDLDATLEIDQAVLDAILKAKKTDPKSRLNLALAWDRCEVARQEILKIENCKDKVQWKDTERRELMYKALVQNKVNQVELLMEHGVDLKKFLTVQRLQNLYAKVLSDTSCGNSAGLLSTLPHREQEWPKDELKFLRRVNKVVNCLLRNQDQKLYYDTKYEVSGKNEDNSKQHDQCQGEKSEVNDKTGDNIKQQKQCQDLPGRNSFQHPEKDLLIWATLLNRKKLACLFWKLNKDPIGSALMASALLKSLSKKADGEKLTDLSLELNKHSIEFEDMAIGVLDECHHLDETMAHKLLLRNLDTWDDTTLLTIANLTKQVDFMGHAACQTKLTEIWEGEKALHTPALKPDEPATTDSCLSNDEPATTDSCLSNTWNKVYYHMPAPVAKFGYRLTAPRAKFGYHTISQILFLVLFSHFVLTDLRPISEPDSPGAVEITVWFWVATIFIEDCRQHISRSYAPRQSFSSWVLPRLLMHGVFCISIILRYTSSGSTFTLARGSYCLTLFMYYMSLLPVSSVAKHTGQKNMMIRPMLKDLMFFFFIFIIFTLAYGVASQALRFPNSDADRTLLENVVYWPYWHWFGELSLDQLEGEDCSRNETELKMNHRLTSCPEESRLTIVLFAIYMVLTNIVLTNLLIAVFSFTFGRKQKKALELWRFYRYNLIHDYCERPVLPPPLIIINHIWLVWRVCKYHFFKKQKRQSSAFRPLFEEKDNIQLTVFERQAMENHLFHSHVSSRQTVDIKVTSAGERIKKVVDDLELIKEHLNIGSPAGKTPTNSKSQGNSGLLQKLVNLQQQLQAQQQQLVGQQQELEEAIELLRNKGKHDREQLSNVREDVDHDGDHVPLAMAGRVSIAGQSELEVETSTA